MGDPWTYSEELLRAGWTQVGTQWRDPLVGDLLGLREAYWHRLSCRQSAWV